MRHLPSNFCPIQALALGSKYGIFNLVLNPTIERYMISRLVLKCEFHLPVGAKRKSRPAGLRDRNFSPPEVGKPFVY